MSKNIKKNLVIPSNVTLEREGSVVKFIGPKGEIKYQFSDIVSINIENNLIFLASNARLAKNARAILGTTRALLENFVHGVSVGFEKKLELHGVGYKAKVQSKVLEMALGHSHPIKYDVPIGIDIECVSNTEIVVRGICKQQVGQVSAEIRKKRPLEPYKGKGIRYYGERVTLKEIRKK